MTTPERRYSEKAFTLVEMMVATGLLGTVGVVMFEILNLMMTFSARNVATNLAHQQGRIGMDRVIRDIHQSVSVPQLVDANFNPINTAGPAAGVTFQIVVNGPFNLANDPASNIIQIDTTTPILVGPPSVGDHLVVLGYNLEEDITRIQTSDNSHWNFTLTGGKQTKIQTKAGSFIVCYITRRVAYLVQNGELRYYPNRVATPNSYAVVARNLTSATPFSVPLNATASLDTRYTHVNFIVSDPTYSNRGYANTKYEIVDAHIPYRCQLTRFQ
ncbi:MAG: type II secretion system protein J [Chthoniobacterales bacterium]